MTPAASLKLERTIPGPCEAVFDAWLDPASLRRFMTPGPSVTVAEASVDPRVGGRFKIVMLADGAELPHEGEYLEIDRPRRLVFTWTSRMVTHTVVTVELEALDERTTRLTLTHDRFDSDVVRSRHESGWTSVLEALAGAMEER